MSVGGGDRRMIVASRDFCPEFGLELSKCERCLGVDLGLPGLDFGFWKLTSRDSPGSRRVICTTRSVASQARD